jgi:PTH1 family peptidyl-tRNA hydrolase
MKLIVGLGNPGLRYTRNRHNAGFMCLKHLARIHSIKFDKKQGRARIGRGEIAGGEVLLARPQTYMNLSGESVIRMSSKYKIYNKNDLLVIHDDLDLPLGKIRLRQGGGSGGHKGVDSIISYLGSKDFIRLRVGIGRPRVYEDTAEISEADIILYVLSDFTPEEKRIINRIIPIVSEAVLCLLTQGLVAAMNQYN